MESPCRSSKVLFLLEPIADFTIHASTVFIEEHVKELHFKNGEWQCTSPRVTSARIQEIRDAALNVNEASHGGGAFGFAKILKKLTFTCQVFGVIGQKGCPLASNYLTTLERLGIDGTRLIRSNSQNHGQCLCIIPEGAKDRFMLTSLGAAKELTKKHLSRELFKDASHLHLEGYSADYDGFLEKAVKYAKENNMSISMDVGQSWIVKDEVRRNRILNLLQSGEIDLFFGNEEEMKALTKLDHVEEICTYLGQLCPTVVTTLAENGVCIKSPLDELPKFYEPKGVSVIDPTGAGDAFGGGFLAAWLLERETDKCVKLATEIASTVIQYTGTTIPEAVWDDGLLNSSLTLLGLSH